MNFVKLSEKPLRGDGFRSILINLDDVSTISPRDPSGSVVYMKRLPSSIDGYIDPGFFWVGETLEEIQKIVAALQGPVPSKDNVTPLTVSQFIDYLYPKSEDRSDQNDPT